MAAEPDHGDPVEAAAAAAARVPAWSCWPARPAAAAAPCCGAITAAVPGPVYAGGGLAMLSTVPALALSRAVRARLPAHDVHLLAEAVRSRVRGGLLVLDDLQYADPATLAALPLLAAHCRVLVALRTPHRLGEAADAALREAAAGVAAGAAADPDAALELARRTRPAGSTTRPLAGGRRPGRRQPPGGHRAGPARRGRARRPPAADIDQVAYAIAAALADLPRPARTALAALGLLGRPAAGRRCSGPGAADLQAAGLVVADGAGGAAAGVDLPGRDRGRAARRGRPGRPAHPAGRADPARRGGPAPGRRR